MSNLISVAILNLFLEGFLYHRWAHVSFNDLSTVFVKLLFTCGLLTSTADPRDNPLLHPVTR